jgi:flagellar biosynthesis regulator FlaF
VVDESDQIPSVPEEQAFQLSQAAIRIDQARREAEVSPEHLIAALNQNMEVWVVTRTTVAREDCPLSNDVKINLTKLSQFVADRTLAGQEISEAGLDALVNINLQISEGLLEGAHKT